MTNIETKVLLRMSQTFEQADDILSKTWCKTDGDKTEYLRQLFPEELKNEENTNNPGKDYRNYINIIINSEENDPYTWGLKDGITKGREEGYEECVKYIMENWNTFRLLSQEGIKERFKRILHKDIF